MIVWIFALLDLLVLTTITITHFSIAQPLYLLILSIVYLSIKGAMFFPEPMSIIDTFFAFYILLLVFGLNITLLYYLAAFWFLYKLIFTLVG